MFRVILAIAVAVFPAFGLAQMLVDPARINPMWARFAFSITAAVLLVSTYRWEWVRTRISQLTSLYLCIVSYWYVALAYWSNFSPEAAVGVLVIFAAVGVGTSFWIQSIALVSTFMVSMMAAVAVCVYSLDSPGIHPSAMVLACLGVGFVIFVAVVAREKADEDMYAQHGLLRSLFDESTDAHILFDTLTGRVIDFNQAALDLFEVADDMLVARALDWRTGLKVLDVDGAIDTQAVELRERKCKGRTGRIFWADVSTRSLQVDELEITLLKVIDITQKREAARKTILDARRAAAVAELSAALTRAGIDDGDPMQIVARTVTRTHADVCMVCCVSDDEEAATTVTISHRDPEMEDVVRAWVADEPICIGEGLIGKVIATGKSVLLEEADFQTLKEHVSVRHQQFLFDEQTHDVVVHPLRAYGNVVGAILFSRETQKRRFTDHDLQFFKEVVEKTGFAYANVRLLDALKRSEARFRNLVQNSSDLILLLDNRARIRYASPSARRLLGFDADELIGERIFTFTHRDDVEGLFAETARIREGKHVVVKASRFRHANGEWRWLEALAVNMLDDASVKGVVINARDITERIRYEEELRTARDLAEEMVRMKDAFLANMSHEIRTPLTAILGFSSVLAEELDAEQREFIGHIHKNGTRLMDALNSVLDLARLESGGVALELSQVDVHKAVDAAVTSFQALAVDRGLTLEASVVLDDAEVCLDASCFDRILTNLVGNAIRFTDEGGVRIDVRQDDADVVISVEDTGIGIGDDFLPHLFTPFRQESSGFSRSHEGTGLGLTITQRLVEVMGGRIDVESRRGVGSAFRVRFPIASEINVQQEIEASSVEDHPSRAA